MITKEHLRALKTIITRLKDQPINWVVTGSLGMALQGVPVEVHDIDLQTDKDGAYEIERLLAEYRVVQVRYKESERIRSHLGKLEIDGIQVEIMGAFQKLLDEHTWEDPVKVEEHRQWVEINGMQAPVLSLEYEYQAYRKLGRTEKAQKLWDWIHRQEK